MTTYLTLITTVLVITQIIRITQNGIQLYRNNKVLRAHLSQIDDITQEDLETQREAYRLIVKRFNDTNNQ